MPSSRKRRPPRIQAALHVLATKHCENCGLAPEEVIARTTFLSRRIEKSGEPRIRFAVGHARLGIKGNPDEALREADEAMYRDKAAAPTRQRLFSL